jgi:peptidyl-prolyl cis-trans isomerase SurA
MKRSNFAIILCVAALPFAARADSVVEEIIARVNNQIVTRTELQREKEKLRQDIAQQAPSESDRVFEEKQKDLLRDLIDQQLLLEKGKDLGISADTEVIKRLDDMRKQMNLSSMEELEKAAAQQGVSYEDFKQNMKEQIIREQVIRSEVSSHMSFSKADEIKYYDAHKAELEQPELIKLSEILIAPKPADKTAGAPASEDEALAAAKTKADEVLKQLRGGAKFEEIARNNSDGPTAAQGGDLGMFKRGTLAKELEDKTFAMKPGDLTDVIRTKQGFVILKVTDHQAAGVPTLKQVEPRIQDAMYMEKLQPALRTYLTKLREDAYIDIKPGYVDSGASPNETKPIETTAAKETSAKKLKKKKKFGII